MTKRRSSSQNNNRGSVDNVALTPKEAVDIGATSLQRYGRLFFPRTFRQESPKFHEDIGVALYGPDRYNAFKIFRDGAKTSLLRVYASQRVAYGLSRTIMYVSVSQQHAMFSLRWLRRQVMYNTRWANTFGLTKGDKWTDEWAEIKQNLMDDGSGMPVTTTILAMGITGQIRGFNPDDFRPDLIIVDDILNEENTATPEQRGKIDSLLFGALLNSLSPQSESPLAKAVFLQTPLNKEDAIEKCMKDPSWNPRVFGVFDEQGESRWPARWSTKVLLAEKEAHMRRSQLKLWMREKECMIISGEEQALDTTKWKTFDTLPEFMDQVWISVDPATPDAIKPDEFAIACLGFKGVDVYVLDYFAEKRTAPDKAINHIFDLMLLYHATRVIVETNAFQKVMKWLFEQEMTRRRMFVATEALTVRTKNADRIMQTIPGLAAWGHFWIRPGHSKLVDQANDYNPEDPNAVDDILTAIANGIVVSNPGFKHRHLSSDVEGKPRELDESEYEELEVSGCP